ncbi:hypothetical protein [Pedobacter sp. SL55]|uniref:hypothetical protein n=1 Tax=Pedobacter sp. SL55 TaxID=2995161 RepID=UPI00226FED54|nr:hypothetical protein [Pedobacter sp. SL55]WAC39930.1 hypothetical protein OVA16_15270 [Pedobacter sp. SL55]
MKFRPHYFLILIAVIFACKSGPFNLLKPASPHKEYERKLVSAGLERNTMGKAWIVKANNLLTNAVGIKLPYKESGYFAADKVDGAGFKFSLQRGQMLTARLTKQSVNQFLIYMDFWERSENGEFKVLAFADSLGAELQWEAKRSGEYFFALTARVIK